MEQIPYLTNDTFSAAWWTPMTVYDGSTYVAFTSISQTANRHFLNIAKKTGSTWKNHMLTRFDYQDNQGHHQTAIAVDGSGRIHVMTGLHVNTWASEGGHYFRSDVAGDITSMVDRSSTLPGQESTLRYTYPIMRRSPLTGDIFLIIRRHDNTLGSAPVVMYKWTNSSATWSSVGIVTSSVDGNMFGYPDDMVITSDGIVHFIFAHQSGEASARRHVPAYLNYNPSTGNFKTADGVTRTLPIHYTTTNLVYKALVSGETITGDEPGPGQQSASLSMALGYPSIIYRHRDTDGGLNKLRRARFSSTVWQDELLYDATQTSPAITHNISGDNLDAYYCSLDGDGIYRLYRYRRSIANGTSAITQVSSTQFSRLYQEDSTLYASHDAGRYQYLVDAS